MRNVGMRFRKNAPSLFQLLPKPSNFRRIHQLFLGITVALLCQTDLAGATGQPALVKQSEFVYVADHDSNDISGFHMDSATGNLTPLPDFPLSLDFPPASIISSPDGRFLYVTVEN